MAHICSYLSALFYDNYQQKEKIRVQKMKNHKMSDVIEKALSC